MYFCFCILRNVNCVHFCDLSNEKQDVLCHVMVLPYIDLIVLKEINEDVSLASLIVLLSHVYLSNEINFSCNKTQHKHAILSFVN